MARWSAMKNNWTPAAIADSTNLTASGFMCIQGGGGTQRVNVLEVYMGGLAAASSPAQMLFSRDTVIGVTALTGVLTGPLDAATAALALPTLAFSSATTLPQRS